MATTSEEDHLVHDIYQRLNLEEDEHLLEYNDDTTTAEQDIPGTEWKHCVVGRLLTEKMINFSIFKQVMASVWRPFFYHLDMDRVMRDGPWNYQQTPILLHRLQPHENPRQVELISLELWVQIHNIPHGFMSERLAVDAGNYIGKHVESDPRNFSTIWKEFLRIRVQVDVRKPLKRKLFVKRSSGEKVCLDFKYERLNTFCYFCERFAYGPWLKAESRRTTQIGARWLRSENDFQTGPNDNFPEEPAIFGQNQTLSTTKEQSIMVVKNHGTHLPDPTQIFDIMPYTTTDTITVVDPKRRRLHEAMGPEHVIMDEDYTSSTFAAEPKNLTLLGFSDVFAVDPIGISGGLALLWKEKDMTQLLSYSRNHIDVMVCMEGFQRWRLTGFYGFPARHNRRMGWNLLRKLHGNSSLPWCVIGDFNDILFPSEKQGHHTHPRVLMEGFRQTLMDCQLYDLGAKGSMVTWENRRQEAAIVRERLGRAVGTTTWSSLFGLAKVYVLQAESSDHLPIFLSLGIQWRRYLQRRFRFENAWTIEEECRQRILRRWSIGSTGSLQHKLLSCSLDLQAWATSQTHKFHCEIKKVKQQMASVRRQACLNKAFLRILEKQYGDLLLQQEMYWKQRSKQHWLTEGDSNSKFFHLMASHKHKKNFISQLKNNNGEWIDWDSGLLTMLLTYYQQLFTSSYGDASPIIDNVDSKVTTSHNQLLLATYTEEEVRRVFFSMHPDKSPGPDGFNPGFFQTYWDIVGTEVTTACLDSLNRDAPMPGMNKINIILIPKKKAPETIANLRPISLSNVTDRIICKVLANRLKQVLPSIISETQSAFIPNRLITDNIIVAYELFHSLKRKTQGKLGSLALKTNMSKAYDRVEWEYLRKLMLKLGFDDIWVSKVMNIVTSVSYHFIRGSDEYGPLIPSRGLRQGDPLSPYLFIICVEGLSASIHKLQEQGYIHGAVVARGAPPVSHLFFVDDTIFFTRATEEEARHLKNILQVYEHASGQKVNFLKSGISFTPNTPPHMKNVICQTLEVAETAGPTNYLGMPSVVGRGKRHIFHYVIEKLTRRLQGWKTTVLSKTRKDILLRTVAQAMPNYLMSLFLLLLDTCQELEKSNGGIRWLKWQRLAIPKIFGGLGYRDMRQFNISLLAKQGWRILKYPHSIAATILKARYFPTTDFFSTSLGNNPSYIWRSILQARSLLSQGCRRRVGDGLNIHIWRDPWLMDPDDPFIHTPSNDQLTPKIRQVFHQRDVDQILQIPLSFSRRTDDWLWTLNTQGEYTVKEGYRLGMEGVTLDLREPDFLWGNIWQLHIPGKVRFFLWRSLRNALPCRTNLKKKHIVIDDNCPICGAAAEDELHILLRCTFATSVWCLYFANWTLPHTSTLHSWFEQIFMILWSLWTNRNEVVWHKKNKPTSPPKQQTRPQWRTPPPNHFKCNVDMAILSSGLYGLGMVIQDCNGLTCARRSILVPGWRDPIMGEALCFREALSWIKRLSFSSICVETDCQMIIKFLNTTQTFSSYFSTIIQDCQALLHEHQFISTAFVKRSANQVAYMIARAAHSMSGFEWGVCPSSFLYDVLSLDLNNMR
ncbi:hypothetical protein K2173_016557 [Erythroxylum novogranatense]|uniref:Reverse transcriptase domain-containing protein n=1 Tax=Erythroxylum novogranatense TaxID=1862640 RepID=A0AAV8SRY9_9ROSI|nr:hypothetical protein K2173_016557 [Erythroxylum novogranatense]